MPSLKPSNPRDMGTPFAARVAARPGVTQRKERTMRRLIAAVGACAVAVGLAGASGTSAPTPAPQPADIAALVEQLGSERFADREAAAAALEKIGAPAAEALQA